MCDLKQTHKKREKVPYRFKGRKSAGLSAEPADFHDTHQDITHHATFHRPFFSTTLVLMVVESGSRRSLLR